MTVLVGNNLSKVYGADEIFSGVNVEIPPGARIALVGPNGAGKTSLIKLFIGAEIPNEGEIHIAHGTRIAHLPQRPELLGAHTLWDEQLHAFDHLRTLEAELHELADRMTQDHSVVERYGTLQAEFERLGGYDYETRIRIVLAGVGFREAQYTMPLNKLSGGQKTRAVLARLLLEEPDLLILDEPTNHLDIYAVEWLEGYLKDYPGAVLAISHDRRFIDNYANAVWEMEFGRLESYRGNYTHYMQQRDERRERLQTEFERQQEFISKEMAYIRKHMGSRWTAQAKGRLKKLETMKKRGKIHEHGALNRRSMNLQLETDARSGDKVLETFDLVAGYDQPLFHMPDALLLRGETAAIIGPNGAGKTTLLKTVIGELPPLSGTSKIGAQVIVGYFAQAHEGLHPEKTVLDEIMETGGMGVAEARSHLGAYLFSGDDVFRTVATLSGGERGRLALAKLALSGANLLLLDEPTNHLDIDAQEVLQGVIEDFEGTVLLVSHDRYLIDALATQIWAIHPHEGIDIYEGSYHEYIAWRKQRDAQLAAQNANGMKATQGAQYAEKVRGMSPYQLKKRVSELESAISELETKQAKLSMQIEQASAAGDSTRVEKLGDEYEQVGAKLEAALEEWAELAEYVE